MRRLAGFDRAEIGRGKFSQVRYAAHGGSIPDDASHRQNRAKPPGSILRRNDGKRVRVADEANGLRDWPCKETPASARLAGVAYVTVRIWGPASG